MRSFGSGRHMKPRLHRCIWLTLGTPMPAMEIPAKRGRYSLNCVLSPKPGMFLHMRLRWFTSVLGRRKKPSNCYKEPSPSAVRPSQT